MSVCTDPYWWDDAPLEPIEAIDLPPSVDIAIIGAGYTGLGAAIPLARAGRQVVVLDRGIPGFGASSRNGGITSGNIRGSYHSLAKEFGPLRTQAIFEEGIAARQDLRAFIEHENLACDYQLTGRVVGIMDAGHLDRAKRDAAELAEKAGISSTIIDGEDMETEIGSKLYAGGVLREDIGGLHPAKLHRELLRLARESGAVILGNTAVTKLMKKTNGFRLETSNGVIEAENVIVATNGYTDAGLPWLRRRLVPVISEIIATEPIDPSIMRTLSPRRRMYGEARNIGYYYRPSPDGTRILLGGRRYHKDPLRARERLRQGLLSIFPQLADTRLSHHWFGYVAFPMNKLPALTVHDGVIYASGFCGSGVVWARWLGQKAAATLLSPEEAETAFRSVGMKAVPFYNGTPWFLPLTMAWYRLQDKLR